MQIGHSTALPQLLPTTGTTPARQQQAQDKAPDARPVEASSDSAASHKAKQRQAGTQEPEQNTKDGSGKTAGGESAEKKALKDPSSEASQQLKELQARDREVRAHEQAHLSAAGKYATSGPTYEYQSGPDGKQYAVGGEVGIDVSAVPDDPSATIAKMQVVQRAAMAPAEPSGQDIHVAAQAAQTASAARAERSKQQMEKMQGNEQSSDADRTPREQTDRNRSAIDSYTAAASDDVQPQFSATA